MSSLSQSLLTSTPTRELAFRRPGRHGDLRLPPRGARGKTLRPGKAGPGPGATPGGKPQGPRRLGGRTEEKSGESQPGLPGVVALRGKNAGGIRPALPQLRRGGAAPMVAANQCAGRDSSFKSNHPPEQP